MEKAFLQCIRKLYSQAEKVSDEIMGHDEADVIVRGRSHCIAGLVEDAFANLLYRKIGSLSNKLRIWIDTPVSVGKFPVKKNPEKLRTRTIYPDIIVSEMLSNNEYLIRHIYELKTNTGWMRDEAAEIVEKMTDQLAWMSKEAKTHCEDSGNDIIFKLSEQTRYDLVVLTSVNNDPEDIAKLISKARTESNGKIGGWLLCKQELSPKHSKGLTEDMLEPYSDFKKMLDEIGVQFST